MRRCAVLLFSLPVILFLGETWSFVQVDYPQNGSTVIQRNFIPLAVQIEAYETVGSVLLQYLIHRTTWTENVTVSSGGLVTSTDILNGTDTANFEIEVEIRGSAIVSLLFHVCVTSSNLTSSILSLPSYNASVSENSLEGHVVLPINVSVPYCDSSGVRLTLKPSSEAFGIINQQLVVTNSSFLDYETRSRYGLMIVALDLEWLDSNFRGTEVTILVQDVNDNAPVVQNSGANVKVSVRTHNATSLVWLNITDADASANGLMTFIFLDGNVNGTFGFDDASRSIILTRIFLQETTFNLTVQVSDGGMPYSRLSVAYFTIRSTRDQTEPMFTSSPYVFELPENLKRGQIIGAINANSASGKAVTDISVHGYEKYFSWSLRNLKIALGVLSPNFCQRSRYVLNATANVASDMTWTNVVILVDPVTNRLHFLQERYNFTVFLNGTVKDVFSVQARDDRHDGPGVDQITYELTDSSDYFDIDRDTGKGQLHVMPQVMSQTEFQMIVTAKTGTGEIPYCQSMAVINIMLIPVNNYSPSFLAVIDGPIVLESEPVNSKIYLINVTDPDIGKAGHVTVHLLSASADWIVLSPSGDSLMLSRKLDYESGDRNITITLKAIDQGSPVRTAVTTLKFHVGDVNDNAPEFVGVEYSMPQYDVQVYENVTVGTMIIKVSAEDADSGDNGLITYSLDPSVDVMFFNISPKTGALSVQKLPARHIQDTFHLNVTAMDHGLPQLKSTAHITVISLEVNDHAPKLQVTGDSTVVFVNENMPTGSVVASFIVTDDDLEDAGRVSIQVAASTVEWLSLDPVTLTLNVSYPLDYESSQTKNGTIVIKAVDHGYFHLSSEMTLTVQLIDVNDNSPLFVSREGILVNGYNVSVNETVVNRTILTALAVDGDSGDNGLITYNLDPSVDGMYFNINSKTGALSVKKLPARHTQDTFHFNVAAMDHGVPQLNSTAHITVISVEVNDHAPKLQVIGDATMVFVNENMPTGSVVASFIVTDDDLEDAGRVSIQVAASTVEWLSLDPVTLTLNVSYPLDYESLQTKNGTIVIKAVDHGYFHLSSEMTLTVQMIDANDNSPLFVNREGILVNGYNVSVNETVVNRTILTVLAVDGDSGDNGLVTYSLDSTDGDEVYFDIIPSKGVISVKQLPARRTQHIFYLSVIAMDHGVPTHKTSTGIRVTVSEVNEYAPVIQTSSQNGTLYLSENTTVGAAVLTLNITDKDYEAAGNVIVLIANASTSWFSLSKRNNSVVLSRPVDYESDPHTANLSLMACDGGHPPLCSVYNLRVFLQDANDNAPQFGPSFGSEWNSTLLTYYVNMWENASANSTVLFVFARDLDSNEKGRVKYMLSDIYDSPYFSIDMVSGRVQLAVALNRRQKSVYMIRVVAEDGGSPSLSTEATIVVELLEVNDHHPTFNLSSDHSVVVDENTAVGTVILNISLDDRDLDQAGMVSLHIVSSTVPWLMLNDTSRSLYVRNSPNFEENNSLGWILLEAEDQGIPPLKSRLNLTIQLRDVNEFKPMFASASYSTTIEAVVSSGETLVVVKAIDQDGSANVVTYNLEVNPSGLFTVNSTSGTISAAASVPEGSYMLTVTATDSGRPRQTSSVPVIITVSLNIVNAPQFTKTPYKAILVDGILAGSHVIQVTAVDPDDSVSLPVTYSLCCSPSFIVNSSSGELQTNTTLNYIQQSRYDLVVTASYRGSLDQLSSNTTVLVFISPSEDALHEPFHCSEPIADWVKTCSSDSLLSIKPDVVNVARGINIQWQNWSTLTGSTDSYMYSIYLLVNTSNSELQYSPAPVFSHTSTQPGTHTLYTPFLNGGAYAVILQVTNGNQSAWARRFMIIGHESKLLQVPTKPIVFESAVFHGKLKWQTSSTGVSVSWYGHFANSLFVEKPWLLNQVKKDPNIPDGYDQLGGHRPRDGRETINGVIEFQLAFQIIQQRTARAIRNASEWLLGSPLDQNATINTTLHNGDHVKVWITATDVFSNQFTDSSDLYVDLTTPELTELSVIVMPEPLLQDFTGKSLADNRPPAVFLHLSIQDCDSGVDYFEWKLGNENNLNHYGFQTKMVENIQMNQTDGCECTVFGECSQLHHVFQVSKQVDELTANNSDYEYSVLAVNHAGLNETHNGTGRVDHQFEKIDWILTITSSTSVAAHWSNVVGGMTMAVEVCDAEINVTDCKRMTEKPVHFSSAQVFSLKKYRLYAVQIQLLDDIGAVMTLSSIRINRTLQDSPDASPQNIHAVSINSTAVTVTWDPPPKDKHNGVLLYYVVYVSPINRKATTLVPEQQRTITGLVAFTEYNVRVAAFTAIGSSPKSIAVKVVTKSSGPSQPPTDVIITNITSSSLTVTWMPPLISFRNGLITGYDVKAVREGVNETLVSPLVVYTNHTLKTLTGLIPYTNYSVSVRAINIAGKSEYSIVISGATREDRPGVPVIKEAIGQSTSTIRVLWMEPSETNGIILSYQIYLRQSESRGNTYVADASDRFYVFRKLKSSTMYYIRIRANTTMGFGNWSSSQSATTFTQYPGAPRHLTALATDKNITVLWDPPDAGNTGNTYAYEITYGPVDGKSNRTGNITDTQKMITGLKPFTEYNFTVKVEAQGAPSSILLVWTRESRPSAVQNFRVEPLGNGRSTFASVRLSWQEPEETNGIIGYKVQYTRILTQMTVTVTVKPEISPYGNFFTYILSHLHGGNMYLFKMMAFNLKENIDGLSEFETKETYPAVPTAPSSVLATAISKAEIDVIWQPPRRPNGIIARYDILYQPAMAVGNIMFSVSLKGNFVNALQRTLTGLEENTTYFITVVAHTDFSSGQMSSLKEQKTFGPEDNQRAHIVNVTVDKFAAHVSWKPPAQNAVNVTSYILNVSVYDEKLVKVIRNKVNISLNFNSTKHLVTGLKPSTFYTFQIQFLQHSALDSAVVYKRTLVAAPSGAPRELKLLDGSLTFESLSFQWLPPLEDEANGMVLSYNVILEHNKTVNTVPFTRPFYVLNKELKPWTEYTVRVAAMTNGGIGPYANLTVETKETDPQITNFSLEPNNSTSIDISFEIETNGQLTLLSLKYSCCQDDKKSVNLLREEMKTNRTLKKHIVLNKLEEGTKYEIELSAANREGFSSSKNTTMTVEDKPSAPPANFQCEADSSVDGTVDLTWGDVPPVHRNGRITEYVVRYFSTWENVQVSPYFEIPGIQGKSQTVPVPTVNATYRFKVAAKTRAGLGVFSQQCNVVIIAKSERVLADGTWLGLIVALIVLVLLAIIHLSFWLRRRHLTGHLKVNAMELNYFTVTRSNPLYPQLDKIRREYPDYEIDREKIRRIRGLGEGNFGEVFLALASGIIEDDIEMKVAVKSLKNGATKEMNEVFFEEMEIMMRYQHENIVRLLGVCTDKDPLYLVTEFMEQGDLKEFLVSKRATGHGQPDQLQFSDQCKILFQIACALSFLSDNNLVHRDIAARNCLVGPGLIIKLADFGLARGTGSDLYYRKLGGTMPIRWMPPEAIFDGKYSVRSDVWSFGVVIWEVFTFGQMPFYGRSNEEVLEESKEGRHLPLPNGCPQTVCDIMEWCWEQDAHKRVTAGELVQLFCTLMSHSKTSSNVPLSSLSEFASIVPSDRARHKNEYIPEDLVSESYRNSRLGSLVVHRTAEEVMWVTENGDDMDHPNSMQSVHYMNKAAGKVSKLEISEVDCQSHNNQNSDADSTSTRSEDHEKDSAVYLPSPYNVDSPFNDSALFDGEL